MSCPPLAQGTDCFFALCNIFYLVLTFKNSFSAFFFRLNSVERPTKIRYISVYMTVSPVQRACYSGIKWIVIGMISFDVGSYFWGIYKRVAWSLFFFFSQKVSGNLFLPLSSNEFWALLSFQIQLWLVFRYDKKKKTKSNNNIKKLGNKLGGLSHFSNKVIVRTPCL